jgi:hypothetical protein
LLQIAIDGKSSQFPPTPRAIDRDRNRLKNQGLRVSELTAIRRNACFPTGSIRPAVIFNYKLDSILTGID